MTEMKKLTDVEFRALLDLWEHCDVEPLVEMFETLDSLMLREARARGFLYVFEAYHQFKTEAKRRRGE